MKRPEGGRERAEGKDGRKGRWWLVTCGSAHSLGSSSELMLGISYFYN